jgi:hypothetical protein
MKPGGAALLTTTTLGIDDNGPMADHPTRFDPDDPYLVELRRTCLALPGADEKTSHGHPVFFTKKIFAIFGAVPKGDHGSDLLARSVLVLPDPEERPALLADERFFTPGYYGPYGWVGLNFAVAEVDWDEVAELVDSSFRNTAPARLVRELDAHR